MPNRLLAAFVLGSFIHFWAFAQEAPQELPKPLRNHDRASLAYRYVESKLSWDANVYIKIELCAKTPIGGGKEKVACIPFGSPTGEFEPIMIPKRKRVDFGGPGQPSRQTHSFYGHKVDGHALRMVASQRMHTHATRFFVMAKIYVDGRHAGQGVGAFPSHFQKPQNANSPLIHVPINIIGKARGEMIRAQIVMGITRTK